MGSWTQTSRLLLMVLAACVLPALRPAGAQDPLFLEPAPLEESSSPWSGTRISEARWYAAADALMLMRDSTPSRPMATLGTLYNDVLNTKDLEAGFQAGARVTLGRRLGERHQLEFTWFDLTLWNDRVAVRDESLNDLAGLGNLFSPFTDFGSPAVPFLDYNYLAEIEYRSELDNFELNLRQQLPMPPGPFAMSVLVGGRFMKIRERFYYNAESITPLAMASSNTVDVRTGNDLWGVQLGALFEFQVSYRSKITLDLKGGIFNNIADQGTIYTHSDPLLGAETYTGFRAENVTAWAGEITLALTYQITPRLTSHAGYQMLWVEGLAQGSGNFEADPLTLANGPADLNHRGYAVYHGPHIGMVLRL